MSKGRWKKFGKEPIELWVAFDCPCGFSAYIEQEGGFRCKCGRVYRLPTVRAEVWTEEGGNQVVCEPVEGISGDKDWTQGGEYLGWDEIESVIQGGKAVKVGMSEVHTMIECTGCKRGVRPRLAICGLCNECAQKEMIRLQRIEVAVLWGEERKYAAETWREQAAQFREDGIIGWAQGCDAVADALEASDC